LAKLIEKIPELFDEIKLSINKQITNSHLLNHTVKNHYSQNRIFFLSELPHAPIIGAGVSAYQDAE
jgi:hypothetical protein